jgi:glycosyltransferase involved in cell wall biosynthesis
VPRDPAVGRGRDHVLAYLGVMGPQDGVDYALRALASLRDDLGRDDVHAAFIGHGDAWDDLVALSRELGLEDRVEFTGRVSDEDVARWLSTADVCLAPDPKNPLNDVSTMNKIVEYMALGRPIVSFDLVEARVSAGDAALYATPNDEDAFAAAIAELLDDAARRQEMGEGGRRRLETSLSWEHSERELLRAYERALELRPPVRASRGRR